MRHICYTLIFNLLVSRLQAQKLAAPLELFQVNQGCCGKTVENHCSRGWRKSIQTEPDNHWVARSGLKITKRIKLHVQSNLCTTTILGTLKYWPLLTGGRCLEETFCYKSYKWNLKMVVVLGKSISIFKNAKIETMKRGQKGKITRYSYLITFLHELHQKQA